MLKREHFLQKIEQHFRVHSVCILLGPRQVGKTTLAQIFVKENSMARRILTDVAWLRIDGLID